MRIILCDDDTAFTQVFEKRLLTVFKEYGITPEIVSAHTGVEALREITCRPTDVLFLDIDMPEKDGFSVAEELTAMPSKPLIIFLSGMEDLVYQSFAFQPFWFLRKTHLEELPQVTEKMLQLLNSRQIHYTVTMNGSSTRIPITEIAYFESQGHYIVVHYNERSLRFKARMSDIETALSKYFFVRCHVGYLLNCRFVQICSRTSVTLTDGTVLPVSRAKAEETQTEESAPMNFWFEMAINAVEVTLILSFLVQYFGYRMACPAKYIWTALFGVLSFGSVAFFSWGQLYEGYASSIQILINIAFCCILLRGPILQKIFVSAFTMGLVAIIATFTALLVAKLSGNNVALLLSRFNSVRIISILITKLLFFVITRIILRVKENGRIKWLDFIPLAAIPTLSIITITLMMYAAIQEPHIQNIVFYAVCIVLALNILIYFLFVRLGQVSKIQTEMALLALQNECLQENAKDIENMYDTVRALRHDLKNHLLCILSMAEERDLTGIEQYTGQLLQQQNTVNKLIMFSGNKVLDAIINSKSAAAERAGIRLSAIITTPLAGISPEDITIILGNALDNAIRAAKGSKRKVVDIHIQPQGAYSSIVIANDIAHPVLSDNPALRTTKNIRYRHGFGIQNMRQAVERNQGLIRFYEQNDRFICDILLLNVQSRNE